MSSNIKKIAIIGLGYVGLPLACAIANLNKYEVVGFDLCEEKIISIKNKISPIEDELASKLLKIVDLDVSTDQKILENTDIFIIAVPTPIDKSFTPNLGPVIGATNTVTQYLKKGGYVIVESTVNPGICDEVVLPILENITSMKGGQDFDLIHCPERIDPGNDQWNVTNIARNVGGTSKQGTKIIAQFYREFVHAEVHEMNNLKEAEATKIIENTFRDINIAYVNELAKSFDAMNIDLINVIKGASNKPFAFMPHYPSCGVGGHCIPVDPYYLIERAKLSGFDHKFLKIARDVNNSMPLYTVEKLVLGLNKAGKSIKGTKIGLLGLSFKANIGDLRESPALEIKEILEKKYEAKLNIFDPHCLNQSTHTNLQDFLNDCEAVVLATNHKEFIQADSRLFSNLRVIVDGKNCLDKEAIKNSGVIYYGIGQN